MLDGASLVHEVVREEPTSWLTQKRDIAYDVHGLIERVTNARLPILERGAAWEKALERSTDDPEHKADAQAVINRSLRRFQTKGKEAIAEVFTNEIDTLSSVDNHLALLVMQDVFDQEATLAAVVLYRDKLTPAQIIELAEAFPAKKPNEPTTTYQQRRQQSFDKVKNIPGKTASETWRLKRGVSDLLNISYNLEKKVTSKTTIDRAYLERPAFLKISRTLLTETHAATNLLERLKAIDRAAEIPTTVDNLEQITSFTKLRPDIKAISFDMFDTLVQWTSTDRERRELMWQRSPAVFARYNLTISPQQFKEIRDRIWYTKFKHPKAALGQ